MPLVHVQAVQRACRDALLLQPERSVQLDDCVHAVRARRSRLTAVHLHIIRFSDAS